MRDRLVALCSRDAAGDLRPAEARHAAYDGLPADFGPFDPDEHDADDGILASASPHHAADGRRAELEALSARRRASATDTTAPQSDREPAHAQPRAPATVALAHRRPPKKLDAADPRKSMLAALGPGLLKSLKKVAPPPEAARPPSPPPLSPKGPKGKTD